MSAILALTTPGRLRQDLKFKAGLPGYVMKPYCKQRTTVSQRPGDAVQQVECWPSVRETPALQKLGVMTDTCNPRAQEVEAEGPEVQIILSYNMSKTSLRYVRPCLLFVCFSWFLRQGLSK